MQTVNASVILDDAYRLIGWDAAQLETRQKQEARQAMSMALQEIFESWWWQELMLAAQFSGATTYTAAATFAAGTFCYFPATQKFYQALQTTTGNAPATLASGSYTVNFAFWAVATAVPSAGDVDLTAAYALGDQVRDPDDGLFYQCIDASALLVVAGAGVPGFNQDYIAAGTYNGQVRYQSEDTFSYIAWDGAVTWQIGQFTPNFSNFTPFYDGDTSPGNPPSDPLISWISVDGSGNPDPTNDPPPTVTSTAMNPHLVPSKWRVLVPFTPEVLVTGDVRAIGSNDPRNSQNFGAVDFEKTITGYRIPGWDSGVPWVWYRRPVPVLTGDDFDSTLAYTAAATITFN